MTPNSQIFCNTPWYELHIYWDGSLGICCQEAHKIYTTGDYNIASMSIADWFNSEPVRQMRQSMLADRPLTACRQCYLEEQHQGISRRMRGNQKSVIFYSEFDESFRQSPGYDKFLYSHQHQGLTITHPIDLHIDLGNYCNLACKMCGPWASSTIASQQVQWGIQDSKKYLGNDWTRNLTVWNNFKQQLLDIPKLNNIHFMGGETLLTDRFEDLVDTLIDAGRFEVCFSFVTNGTVFRPELLEKLKQFRRVGIEVSIETVTEHNSYQRQGTDTAEVLANIDQYITHCNGSNITVTLRPATSALTIGKFYTLLEYALEKQLLIKHNLCYNPSFLNPRVLPKSVRAEYVQHYLAILEKINVETHNRDFNASDPNNYVQVVGSEAEMCVDILNNSQDYSHELEQLVRHCERWDRVYGYDARVLYPEWQEFLQTHGYQV